MAGQKLVVFAFDATTNLPKNGDAANITAYANLDDAGVNALADTSATEIDATNAKGYYLFDLAQAETNGNKNLYTAKSTTANVVVIAVPAVVYTLPPNLTAMAIDSSGIVKSYDNLGNTLATAAAVANIAVTGAALNATSGSRTITTGTGTGGVANTTGVDGVYDNIADSAGTIDFYYQFDLSATAGSAAVGVQWTGYVVGVVNTLKVYAYNWGGSSWDQIGTVVGIAGTVNSVEEWELTSAHTGTGGNLGLVRIRFNATGLTSATVKTDRILGGYAVISTSVDTPGVTTLLSRISSSITISGGLVATADPWSKSLPGSYGAGTAGAILGGDTDPWSVALPGSYGAGTAGNILAGVKTTIGTAGAGLTAVTLAAAGLDAIAITDPGNASALTTFPKLLVALCRRMFWKKSTLNATKLNMYADNGTTVNMHMPVSDDGTTQTQGAAVDGP